MTKTCANQSDFYRRDMKCKLKITG